MKKILQTSLFLLIGINIIAQIPQKISYQAVVRNSNNQLVSNGAVGMRVSILKESATGTIVYSEIYNPNPITNTNGLISLEIGTGIPITGNFATIDWANGPYFIKTETDPTGATNYTIIATKELISVPYALHAGNSVSYTEGQGITIQNNKIALASQNAQSGEVLKWNGTGWNPASDNVGGNYVAGPGIDINNNTIGLAKQNAQLGQVLKWNGTSWTPGIDSNSTNFWMLNGNNIFRNTGFVGIGNNNPQFPLDVRLARKNGVMRVLDEAIDTAHRRPFSVSYNTSANSGIGILSSAGKNPFRNMDTLSGNPANTHMGILGAGDDFGLVGAGNTGVLGTGLDGGRFYGSEFGLVCEGGQQGMLIFAPNDKIGLSVYGKTWIQGEELAIFSGNPNVLFSVSNFSETTDNAGYFELWGPGGNRNIVATDLLNNPDNGFLAIFNDATIEAGMYLDNNKRGVLFGDIKNFRMKHPNKPGKEIWYASLEGPEAAAYVRGTAELINGEAMIVFSEDFQIVSNSKTMTVNLTPGSSDSKGLAVMDKTNIGFKVKELFNGNGNYLFDWEVKCVRKGYEDYRVIRDANEIQTAESKNAYRSEKQKLTNRLTRYLNK
ncbi:MAG: hypothetical protein WAS55_07825 [Saprospiraceae bacterium]